MSDFLDFLDKNSGALTVLFTAVVTIATAVYAVLTGILVRETRMMREVQTEPRLQVTVQSLDFAVQIVRIHIRNIGLGPALNVSFKPKVLSGGPSAEKLLGEFTDVNFFRVGLRYFGPGQERVSAFTQLTEDHDGKMASMLALDVTYRSTTGKDYSDVLVVDMSELKGNYQLGTPNAYAIAKSLEKIQKDLHQLVSGSRRVKSDVYTRDDRVQERIEAQTQRERWEAEVKAQQGFQAAAPSSGELANERDS